MCQDGKITVCIELKLNTHFFVDSRCEIRTLESAKLLQKSQKKKKNSKYSYHCHNKFIFYSLCNFLGLLLAFM